MHLKRTVHYAAQTLRDKLYDKIPTMRFPALPTSELALAFRLPYLNWLPCDTLLGMKQKLIKKDEDRVTASKCNLYTFRGHLHLNLPYVRIMSP